MRGGLFADNGKPWKLGDEMKYMNDMRTLLEERGVDYAFYTNGSFLDNNSLLYFAKEYEIPPERIIIPQSTRKLVETVYGFTSVAAIRMHSSIISYALSVPSVNLVWNDKIPFFYQNIGYPDRAVSFDDWSAEAAIKRLAEIDNDLGYEPDEAYMMSLYDFLLDLMGRFLGVDTEQIEKFDCGRVKTELMNDPVSLQEDLDELVLKVQKGEKHYLSRFVEMKKQDREFRQLKKDCEKKDREIKRLKRESEKLNRLLIVRVYKKLRSIKRKIMQSK